MDKADESAAWRDLETAISDALWRYAEAVTGVLRDAAGQITEGPFAAGRVLHLARLSAIRRIRQALGAAERAEAAAAIGHGGHLPDARRRRRDGTPDRLEALPARPQPGPAQHRQRRRARRRRHPEVTKGILADSLLRPSARLM